jgi:glycosyltransferase involved in cell wall biosynthesis
MGHNGPTFSVAIPTKGRTGELTELLRSISQSSLRPSQIIIVDQNDDDRLAGVISEFPDLPLAHHRVDFAGLSAAKNYAARLATGEFVFTPDDDSRVFPSTFESAIDTLAATGADVVFGRSVDGNGNESITRFRQDAGWLARDRIDGMFVEPATAVRTQVLRGTPFDETLGVGTFHGAEEGYDWVLRLLSEQRRLYFEPAITFFHPQTITDYGSSKALRRVFHYRAGFGRLCKKHGLWGKYLGRTALVASAIVVYSVTNRIKLRYYAAELAGLIAGVSVDP